MRQVITINDLLIVPVCLILLSVLAFYIKQKNISQASYYRFFIPGFYLKIFAGLAFALIYTFHYGETDTHYYYWGTQTLVRVAEKDFGIFLKIMVGVRTPEVFSVFDQTTGWPTYWRDPNSFAVCRFNVPLYLLGFKSFLGNIMVLNAFLYIGVWKFYKLMLKMFPSNEKHFAIALLFVPSVVFWGSSLLKDSWCFVASLFIFCAVYHLFIVHKHIIGNILLLFIWGYICVSIRPYTFFTTAAACLIWVGFVFIYKLKSRFLRTLIFPLIALVLWVVGIGIFSKMSGFVNSRYQSIDSILETAAIIQDDLRRDYYGGNSFDIGAFEPTLMGIAKKAPQAVLAGAFRPFLWEVRNVLMLISALETFILILLWCYVVLKLGIRGILKIVFKSPFLLGASVFMFTYAFFVGLTTANFGALVRYRLLVVVFMVLILAILWRYISYNKTLRESGKLLNDR